MDITAARGQLDRAVGMMELAAATVALKLARDALAFEKAQPIVRVDTVRRLEEIVEVLDAGFGDG